MSNNAPKPNKAKAMNKFGCKKWPNKIPDIKQTVKRTEINSMARIKEFVLL